MTFVIWLALVALVHMLRTATLSPPSEPVPFCSTCGARFLDQVGLDQHREAAHPNTFDDGRVIPAKYRNPEGT